MGLRPYTHRMMQYRAEKLANAYPQYDKNLIISFSESVTLYDEKHGLSRKEDGTI